MSWNIFCGKILNAFNSTLQREANIRTVSFSFLTIWVGLCLSWPMVLFRDLNRSSVFALIGTLRKAWKANPTTLMLIVVLVSVRWRLALRLGELLRFYLLQTLTQQQKKETKKQQYCNRESEPVVVLIKELPHEYHETLAVIFNASLMLAYIPNSWKLASVVMIPQTAHMVHSRKNHCKIAKWFLSAQMHKWSNFETHRSFQ